MGEDTDDDDDDDWGFRARSLQRSFCARVKIGIMLLLIRGWKDAVQIQRDAPLHHPAFLTHGTAKSLSMIQSLMSVNIFNAERRDKY